MSAQDWVTLLGPLVAGGLGVALGLRLRGKAPPDASRLRAVEKKRGIK